MTSRKNRIVYGVGINDSDYKLVTMYRGKQVVCPYYEKWKSLLSRCYSKAALNKSDRYVMCKEWLTFSNFKKWMKKQDRCNKTLITVLNSGDKIYSPETCFFIEKRFSNILKDNKEMRGKYPQGVNRIKNTGRYTSTISINKKPTFLGTFDTLKEARLAYIAAKVDYINMVAMLSKDELLKKALMIFSCKLAEALSV